MITAELALANRILTAERVLDAFGHVSVRSPKRPDRYLLARSRAPELIEVSDILEFDLDSRAIEATDAALYAERVIHGEIYRLRPDVMAVCHHHAAAFLPFCITGEDYLPIMPLGAVGGLRPPFWDQREGFGDTNLLVKTRDEGRSLARALGANNLVLMKRHGVTVVGASLQELVFRAIYSCRNAESQWQALAVGPVDALSAGETEAAAQSASPAIRRAWELWVNRQAGQ
jgi:HCOMODA/2-hydroxy-3-carboxy-muconic semialdehyde decarboxylase